MCEETLEILCVGDLHGAWDEVDLEFVESGSQELVVFVGDLGHNDPGIVREIAALSCPTFVLLGNHDAWDEMVGLRRELAAEAIRSLGEAFGGYRSRPIAGGRLGVVGCRPFSWGGAWRDDYGPFYQRHFGVVDDAQSAAKIVSAAASLGGVPLILIGHQGPAGLGQGRNAIFGRDFASPAVDFGDADFRMAVDTLRRTQPIVATIAGHMHESLCGGGRRVRTAWEGGTLHVNAAVVPRHVQSGGVLLRHFVRLRISTRAAAVDADDIWVDDKGQVAHVVSMLI